MSFGWRWASDFIARRFAVVSEVSVIPHDRSRHSKRSTIKQDGWPSPRHMPSIDWSSSNAELPNDTSNCDGLQWIPGLPSCGSRVASMACLALVAPHTTSVVLAYCTVCRARRFCCTSMIPARINLLVSVARSRYQSSIHYQITILVKNYPFLPFGRCKINIRWLTK